MDKTRCVATVVITVFAAYVVYQLSWIYWMVTKMETWGFTNIQFYPVAYALAGLTLTIGASISWRLRPKTLPKPIDTLPKHERIKLTEYWKLLQKEGTPEQKKRFLAEYGKYFNDADVESTVQSFPPLAEKTENQTSEIRAHSLSPNSPSSPPELPIRVENTGEKTIMIKIPFTALQQSPVQTNLENSNFESNFNTQMEVLVLKALEDGTLNTNVTIKRENGKFKLPENFEFSIVKKEAEKPPQTTQSVKQEKKPKLERPIP